MEICSVVYEGLCILKEVACISFEILERSILIAAVISDGYWDEQLLTQKHNTALL